MRKNYMWLMSCFLFKKSVHVLMLLATSLICQMCMKTEKRVEPNFFRHIQCWKIYNSIFSSGILCLLSKNFFVCKKQELLHRISSLHWEKGVATNILCFSSHSKSLWPPLVHSLLSRISWSPAVKKVLPYLYREGKYSFPEELWWWLRLSY